MINANNLLQDQFIPSCYEIDKSSHDPKDAFQVGNIPIGCKCKEYVERYLSQIDKNKIPCSLWENKVLNPLPNKDISHKHKQRYSKRLICNNAPLNTKIDINQVSSFKIYRGCIDVYPCMHKCTILSGDAEVTKTLDATQIKWCVDKISNDKITYDGVSSSHFDNYS
jgi:hypothetical protein